MVARLRGAEFTIFQGHWYPKLDRSLVIATDALVDVADAMGYVDIALYVAALEQQGPLILNRLPGIAREESYEHP